MHFVSRGSYPFSHLPTQIRSPASVGGSTMLRMDRMVSVLDPETQSKVEALERQQGSDAAKLGATVAKLTMRCWAEGMGT